jgi:outer membrane protein insertion porin family
VARDFIVLREGELFTTEAFNASMDALKKSNLFQKIDVPDPRVDNEQMILSFTVTPFPRIKKIFIEGGFPLFRKEIRDAIGIHSGAAYEKKKMAAKEAKIVELFQKEGYIRPQARIEAEQDPVDDKMIVTVNIDKGPYYNVQEVNILGNHGFSNGRLKLRLNTWKACLLFGEMQRFRKKDLKKDVRNLEQFYRQKQYPNMTLETQVNKNDETGIVRITFTIQEGPRYDMVFEGNEAFWDLTLKQDLVLFKEGNKNDFGLRKSIQKMRRRYRQAGFLDARLQVVSEEIQEQGSPTRKIRIVIAEGPRHVVHTIILSGNEVFGEEEIRSEMLTRRPGFFEKGQFVPQVLKEDIQAIVSLYLKKGYMDVQVTDHVEKKESADTGQVLVDISLHIDEGIQTQVSSVAFHGLTALTDSEALEAVALKTGEPFREYMIKSDENTLSALISEKGFPHVKVAGAVELSEKKSHAVVTYTVEQGPSVKMGQVFYTGNVRTKGRVIRNAAKISSGEPFSLKKMLAAQRNIRNIEAFGSVRLRTLGLKEKDQKVDLLAEIEEKRPYYLQLGAGYDTERRIFGHTRVGDQNLFGLNKDIWTGGEISESGYRGEGEITEPRLFN